MRIRFWGVRGSIASAGASTALVGGNTSCVEVRCGSELLILDAGTGLRALGDSLIADGGPVEATLLVSHFHWDHIQGLPFFAPAYLPATRLLVCGASPDGSDQGVREAFAAQMRPPHFPVGLEAMRAALSFRAIAAEYAGQGRGPCRRGWGHSTADEAIRLARAAGVGRLLLFHHDPSHDDAEVARIEAEARARWPALEAAREGRELVLPSVSVAA